MRRTRDGKAWRSAAEWRLLLEKQKGSGLGQCTFCRREGVSLTSFKNWRRKLQGGRGSRAPIAGGSLPVPVAERRGGQATFVEVRGEAPAAVREVVVELELPHGMRLLVRGARC